MKGRATLIPLIGVLALIVASCGGEDAATTTTTVATTTTTVATTTTTAPTTTTTTTTEPAFVAPDGALVSVPVDSAPTLDGDVDGVWDGAEAIEIPVAGGVNSDGTTVSIKSVYSGDMVYFFASWADDTMSFMRFPWEKQADGTWKQLTDPNDTIGHDDNMFYEDKMALIWDTKANPIANFESVGCFVLCHAGESPTAKAYGNKYTANDGEIGDIWHWKSVRNLNQADDQYVDATRWSEETDSAGRHGDPKDGGGYVNNKTEDGSLPAYMPPDGGAKDGSPGWILDSEKVDFDDSLFAAGDRVPGIYKSQFTGDRGDIAAGWKYEDGVYYVELARKLVTGSEFDVQFEDMADIYYFGVSVFNNSQVRHHYETGVSTMVFMP